MTNEEMKAELVRANSAIVDKIGKQPYMGLDLTLHDSGVWICSGCYFDREMSSRFGGKPCDTPEAAIASAFEKIDALPSPEDAVKHEYLTRVASAIDYATENSLPDEYVAPLRGVSTAMTENLLTHSKAGAA